MRSPCSPSKGSNKDNDAVTETEQVHVSVRVRPLNKRERTSKKSICLRANSLANQLAIFGEGGEACPRDTVLSTDRPSERAIETVFQFDSVFWSANSPSDDPDAGPATQSDVFQRIGISLVERAFCGFNSCLFAYGQTGSGKTYTMMGADVNALEIDQGSGVAPRIFQEIFRRKTEIESAEGGASVWNVKLGYVEVYNERVSDLLAKRAKSGEEVFVEVREHPKRGVFMEGQRLVPVQSLVDVASYVESGNTVRHTASTKMNNRSSRSHAIIMLLLNEERTMTTKSHTSIRTAGKSSRMNLVDLAGSERVAQSEVEGARFTEATHINLSLTTLGRVIDILADMATKGPKTRYTLPPFRDSKLTFILKDSLGGNSKTMMLATVSPSALNYEETLNTLRYASRARDIINVAKVNEDPRARRIRQLEVEMAEMRKVLAVADPAYVSQLEEKIAMIESEAQNRAADLQALEKEREESQLRERMLKATEAERAELEMQASVLRKQVADSKRQAAEMQEQNLRLREEQARRERQLLDDVERAKADIRLKDERLEQAKMELAHERTEREKAVRFIQHYKEKLEDALFSSQRNAAERVALEQANTNLNLKLKELEEEQRQYVDGLVLKLEGYETQAVLERRLHTLLNEESDERIEMCLEHGAELVGLLHQWYKACLCRSVIKQSAGVGKDPTDALSQQLSTGVVPMPEVRLPHDDLDGASSNGATRSPAGASEPQEGHLMELHEDQTRTFREVTNGKTELALLLEGHLSTLDEEEDVDLAQMRLDPDAQRFWLLHGVKKVKHVEDNYRRCLAAVKAEAELLRDAQRTLEELVERFLTDSNYAESEEHTIASRLSDVELARGALQVRKGNLEVLNQELEERAREGRVAVQSLERQVKAVLQEGFEVRLYFHGAEGGAELFKEPQMDDFDDSVLKDSLYLVSDSSREAVMYNSANSGAPVLSHRCENGALFDVSAIRRSTLESFPTSARVAALLNEVME